MNQWAEQMRFTRSLKGAAASVLWILILSQRSCTLKELETATGYTDKPLTTGLALLEAEEFIQYNGRRHGWSLAAGFYQLPLPFNRLPGGMAKPDAPGYVATDAAMPGIPNHAAMPGVSNGQIDRNNSDLNQIDRNYSDLRVLSSSSLNTKTLVNTREEEEEADPDRNNSDLRQLLIRGGVGKRSKMMQVLLNEQLDTAYVLAHVTYRETCLAKGEDYPPGNLITKLLSRDPAPVVRHPHKQHIPAEVRHIIKS